MDRIRYRPLYVAVTSWATVFLLGIPAFAQPADQGYSIAPATHSHNDYYQARPLMDALESGMASIEADLFYVEFPFEAGEGETRAMRELFVAHDWEEIEGNVVGFGRTRGTLSELYLDPLWEIFLDTGTIYADGTLLLHADMKTDTATTWRVLESTLRNYPGLFTSFDLETETVVPGPVTVYTNEEPSAEILEEYGTVHSTADGRFGDIFDPAVWESDAYLDRAWRMPIISSNLQAYNDIEQMFEFLVPEDEIVREYSADYPDLTEENLRTELDADGWALATELLRDRRIRVSNYLIEQMEEANRLGTMHGHLIRFWASPDGPWFWDIVAPLENVVLLTDRPEDVAVYLESRDLLEGISEP